MIVNHITKSEFRDAFIRMDRKENFSYQGLGVLYDWLEEFYEEADKPYELDVIALCCDFTEYDSLEDFNNDYNREYEDVDDISEDTLVMKIDSSSFIIQNF